MLDRAGLAVALVVALLGMCLADVAHAAMPHDRMPMECAAQLCSGLSGCSPTSAAVLHGLPVGTVPPASTIAAPMTAVSVTGVAEPSATSKHRVLLLAPRSPPLA